MGRFMKGDIVVLPFSFSDLSQPKKRPALVLVDLGHLKKIAMDSAKEQAVDLTQMLQQSAKAMELSVNPNLDGNNFY